ncbi:hypothetical protein ACJIZ3_007887 [Penstemon smallii]|uniref:PWWP domain-containing protein n=1 Tax=Penstemon smallii TaxID=265156 RepID=A0ABD3T875_9LAMI
MGTPEDIVAATKVIAEDSETVMGGSGSEPEENRVRELGVEKDGNGGSVVVKTGEGERNVEKSANQEHEFRVGDFVWGKIKNHPWWPGQIYDSKDASEFAMRYFQEGRLLVAFFGDGSCAWCLPSQLVPFVENFEEMSKDSNSKSFLKAVQSAVDDVSRVVESKILCNCIPEENKGGLGRIVVANVGLKEGVLMPEVDFDRLRIPKFEPYELLDKVRHFAKIVSVGNALEVAVVRSWLSAFYRFKGCYQLPSYHEAIHIEGLEDKNQEDPILGPMDDDWLSSLVVSSAKSEAFSDDKIYQRRKQKSVAELMGGNSKMKPKIKKQANDNSKSSQKRKKIDDEEEDESGKRKVEVSESSKETKKDVSNEETSGVGGSNIRKSNDIKVDANETNSDDSREKLENATSPRERKKSKYLCPPYTDLISISGRSRSKTEVETESNKIEKMAEVGEQIARLARRLPESPTVPKRVVKTSEKPQTFENDKNLTFSLSDVDTPVYEILSEVQSAAVDHRHLNKEGSYDKVWSFVSAFRSSIYSQGSNYKAYRSIEMGKKRKSPSQKTHKSEKKEGTSDVSKTKKVAEVSGSKSGGEDLNSDVRVITKKLGAITATLEKHHLKLSDANKSSLKDEMKDLMEKVEAVSEKVRNMVEN